MKHVIGNWKSQKTTAEGLQWLDKFATSYRPADNVKVGLAPTIVSLESLVAYAKKLGLHNFDFAVQDISPFPRGSYTGAVAADQVKGLAHYAIIAHVERQRYFHETLQDGLNKVSKAVDAGIIPIFCVESAATLSQLTSLGDMEIEMLLAYTPTDPGVSGMPEPIDKVREMLSRMKQAVPSAGLLYGGKISASNCAQYFALDGLDGLFVGEASLDAARFAEICNLAG